MGDWLTVETPDGELWEPQELTIRKSLIAGVQWNRKLGTSGSDNGVKILLLSSNYSASHTYWVRCKDAELASLLYERIVAELAHDS